MFRASKFFLILLCNLAATSGFSFSLLGPAAPWQTPDIGYLRGGQFGGSMNLGEEYRRNVPVLTYAFDDSFFQYFGSNGVRAIDQAMKILNDIPPASRINLGTNCDDPASFFKCNTRSVNPAAAALNMYDLKSEALHLLVEESGLAFPEYNVWALRGVATFQVGMLTFTNVIVIMRNFDPVTYKPTNSVNGIDYDYLILTPPPYFDAIEVPSAFSGTSIAGDSLQTGAFYFGITRDDAGGLRYLLRRDNRNVEDLPANTFFVSGSTTTSSPWLPLFASGFTNSFFTNFVGNVFVTQGLRGGVEKVSYRKVKFDSLLGQVITPITNRFIDRVFSNGRQISQVVERISFVPDILFSARDLGLDPFGDPFLVERTGAAGWINNDAINGFPGDNGPGVIANSVNISFSNLGPFQSQILPFGFGFDFVWGSFDDTEITAIYPESLNLTVQDLENRSTP